MESFIAELSEYADRAGVSPSTVIQRAKCGNGTTWRRWVDGKGSPTLTTVDKLRKYFADNPPVSDEASEDAA